MPAGPAIGIDLGTSYSCAAIVQDGTPVALCDAKGVPIHASVVSFLPNGAVLVGDPAKKRLAIDARSTIASVKRMIGRTFKDPIVEEMRRRYFYEIREGIGGLPVIVVRGREFSVPEISAFVLRRMKQIAQEALQTEVTQAVITVPANFGDAQRRATKMAGQLAALKVLRVINEPTAAALAYGYGKGLNAKLAVYDFGGGTFDLTILDIHGDVFEVIATAGEPYLGGDDFDSRLMDYMATAFLRLNRYDLRENEVAMMRLRQVAEQVKIELSTREQVTVRVQEIAHGPDGAPLHLEFTLTRKGFEDKCGDIVQRSFVVCDEALRLAGLKAGAVDHVALVGGTTRIPLVRQMVGEYFGKEPRTDLNPDQVVALGAALQAAALTEAVSLDGMVAESELLTGSAPATEALAHPEDAGLRSPLPVVQPGEDPPLPTLVGLGPAARPIGLSATSASLPAVAPTQEVDERIEPDSDFDEATPTSFAKLKLEKKTIQLPAGPVGAPLLTPPAPAVVGGSAATATGKGVGTGAVGGAARKAPLAAPGARRPVLLDVTPRGLAVGTVSGYAEQLIPRNAPIPVEQGRLFVTSSDDQTLVRIQVLQGESNRAEDCLKLGELVLSDIPPEVRGAVKIQVTFEVDTDGMLRVRARDTATGRVQKATLSIAGSLNEEDMKTLMSVPAPPVVAAEE